MNIQMVTSFIIVLQLEIRAWNGYLSSPSFFAAHLPFLPDTKIKYVFISGWMMWNWMVTALALGTTLVLYDGSPLHPHPGALWDLVINLLSLIFSC